MQLNEVTTCVVPILKFQCVSRLFCFCLQCNRIIHPDCDFLFNPLSVAWYVQNCNHLLIMLFLKWRLKEWYMVCKLKISFKNIIFFQITVVLDICVEVLRAKVPINDTDQFMCSLETNMHSYVLMQTIYHKGH